MGKVEEEKQKKLREVVQELKVVHEKLKLSEEVNEKATEILKIALEEGVLREYPVKEMVCGSLYIAIKGTKEELPIDDIARIAGISRKRVGQSYRILVTRLQLKKT